MAGDRLLDAVAAAASAGADPELALRAATNRYIATVKEREDG